MKKVFLWFFSIMILLGLLTAHVHAEKKTYSWYCKHEKDHVQPKAPPELAFIGQHNGYYIDNAHKRIDDNDKVIYLTFDAGYENGNVAKTLDILKEKNVPGAFFILRTLIDKNPELVKRIHAEGHLLCNHTCSHKDMSKVGDSELIGELSQLETLCMDQLGIEMAKYYRPPEGRFSEDNLIAADKHGYQTIFWSFAYPDWDNNKQMSTEKAKKIILENVHNGEVMLLHPTSATNAQILGEVIELLKADGYRFGCLDELVKNAKETNENARTQT